MTMSAFANRASSDTGMSIDALLKGSGECPYVGLVSRFPCWENGTGAQSLQGHVDWKKKPSMKDSNLV